MALEGVINREAMENAIANGGSVLFHSRDKDGQVIGLGTPITAIENLPTKGQIGKSFNDAASTDAYKVEVEAKIAAMQAELVAVNGEVPVSDENPDDLLNKFNADPNSITYSELKAVARKVGLEKFGQAAKSDLIEQIKTKQAEGQIQQDNPNG